MREKKKTVKPENAISETMKEIKLIQPGFQKLVDLVEERKSKEFPLKLEKKSHLIHHEAWL